MKVNKNYERFRNVQEAVQVYNSFKWIVDAYVLDFYTEDLWERLPTSWTSFLNDISCTDLADILDIDRGVVLFKVMPLSLVALRSLLKRLVLSRSPTGNKLAQSNELPLLHERCKFAKTFWKNVKRKKQYEIEIMSKHTYDTAREANCYNVVDVGSGLGHLSRSLSFGYGLRVCALESKEDLHVQAKALDDALNRALLRYGINAPKFMPMHVHKHLETDVNCGNFMALVLNALDAVDTNFRFGIVGLHPCGDLGATLLRLYKHCKNVAFINVVGCCYMKLSDETTDTVLRGFPLSREIIDADYHLSYNAKEIACHSIETYVSKLRTRNCSDLRIHNYRAMLEKLIVQLMPNLRHKPVASIKYTPGMIFLDYCKSALRKQTLPIDGDFIAAFDIEGKLNRWMDVVKFCSLRLMFAPLLETIILVDRLMYIEGIGTCQMQAMFDPSISPRNQILTSIKYNNM